MGLSISTGLVDSNGEWWLPLDEANFVLKLNKNREVISLIKLNADKCRKDREWRKVKKVLQWREKIYLFSKDIFSFWEINMKSFEVLYVPFFSDDNIFITNVCQVEENAYVFTNDFAIPIIVINLMTHDIHTISYDKNLGNSSITRVVTDDKAIFFCNREKKKIYMIKLERLNEKMSYYPLDSAIYVNCLCIDDGRIWVLQKSINGKTELVRYNKNGGIECTLDLSNDIELPDTIALDYFSMASSENQIILMNVKKCAITVVEKNTGLVHVIENKKSINKYITGGNIIQNEYQLTSNGVVIFALNYDAIQFFNSTNLTYDDVSISRLEKYIRMAAFDFSLILREKGDYGLKQFLGDLVNE